MKVHPRFAQTVGLAAAAVLLAINPVGAANWTEATDAGDALGTAQATVGSGSLTSINGTLPTDTDLDIFRIQITDRTNFRAAIEPLAGNSDPDIWLFDANGFGISANNTVTNGAAWVTGLNVPSNGTYYLAISNNGAEPVSGGGDIWLPGYVYGERAPDGLGGTQMFDYWNSYGINDKTSYTVDLTGAGFSAVPEPGTLSVVAAGLGGLLLRRRKRD